MSVNMKGKSLVSINDLSHEEIYQIFELSASLKLKQLTSEPHRLLEGKTLGNDLFQAFYENTCFI